MRVEGRGPTKYRERLSVSALPIRTTQTATIRVFHVKRPTISSRTTTQCQIDLTRRRRKSSQQPHNSGKSLLSH